MAISTFGVALKWGATAENVKKVVDVKDFPDLVGDPNLIETTTLADSQQTHINGIRQSDTLSFTANFTGADFKAVNNEANKPLYYELAFSDGSKFTWQGEHTCGVPGKGVDEVIEFTINIAASTPVEFSAAS